MSGASFSESADADRTALPPPGPKLWPWLALFGAIVVLVVWLGFSGGRIGRAGAGRKHASVGARLEQLPLQPLTGGGPAVSAKNLQGKVTLINFWGTWCPPCRMEFPHIVEIEQHFRSHADFQFLSISYPGGDDEDLGSATAEFLQYFKADFPTYQDSSGKFIGVVVGAAKLDGFVFPTSIVLDREGKIRGLWPGYMPRDELEIQRVIDDTLRSKTPRP
jgi:thiol-disulfide isomerase/thioredoxin